jgi:hypothetical protein
LTGLSKNVGQDVFVFNPISNSSNIWTFAEMEDYKKLIHHFLIPLSPCRLDYGKELEVNISCVLCILY